tara:strand:+ start:1182 stop:1925 length:744 start_codon:yes stop_codon:yes gene_type:complete
MGCLWDTNYFSAVKDPGQLAPLFDVLPDVFFFAKDKEGRFTAMNAPLIAVIGVSSDEVLGATDYDFFDHDLADAYRQEDLALMESGKSVVNEPWWVPNVKTGHIHWYCASKVSLKNDQGQVIGIAGIMRPIEDTTELSTDHRQMTEVAAYIESHYDERLTVEQLAEVAELSPRHFQRIFNRVFKTGPIEHLMRVRISISAAQLIGSKDSLSTIAINCGFYDQAHFSNQFKRHRGTTPSDYRAHFSAR